MMHPADDEEVRVPSGWRDVLRLGIASVCTALLPPSLMVVYLESTGGARQIRDNYVEVAMVLAVISGLFPLNLFRMSVAERAVVNVGYFILMWMFLFGFCWVYAST